MVAHPKMRRFTPLDPTRDSLLCEKLVLDAAKGAVFLSVSGISRALGQASQTTRNQLREGRFPVPSRRVNGRRVWHIDDVLAFVRSHRGDITSGNSKY